MAKFPWQDFLEQGQQVSEAGGNLEGSLQGIQQELHRRKLELSLTVGLIAAGIALFFLIWAYGESWVTAGPLFTLIGGTAVFCFLILTWVCGGLFFLLTEASMVCSWAAEKLPFGEEPYRSAAGVLAVFILMARYWREVPYARRLPFRVIQVVHWFVWAVAVGAGGVAVLWRYT